MRTQFVVTLVMCFTSGIARGQEARTGDKADSSAIDSVAAALFAMELAPGMAVTVVRDGRVLYAAGFGHADREAGRRVTPETIFYIASTTKAFTGLAAAILDSRGQFQLDAPLSRYLPEARFQAPLSGDSITIRALLSHTHGISNDGPVLWRTAFTGEFENNDQLVALLSEHAPATTGRSYRYSNIGYNVASFAMDRVLRRSWKDILATEIFRPLAMASTTAYVSRAGETRLAMPYRFSGSSFEREPYGKQDSNMQAAGGLVSTANDLARWLEAQINLGRVDGRQVLPAAAVRESQRIQVQTDLPIPGGRQIGYSLGWQVQVRGGDTVYAHGGGFTGFATMIVFAPRHRLGIAAMANDASLGGTLVGLVTDAIYRRLVGPPHALGPDIAMEAERAKEGVRGDRARRAARSQVLPHPLEAYAGIYENPSYGVIELRVANDFLEASAGASRSRLEVFNAELNQLRAALTGSGSVMTVEMHNGRAARITYLGSTFTRR